MNKVLLLGCNGMLGQRVLEQIIDDKNIEVIASSAEDKCYYSEVKYIQLDLTDLEKLKEKVLEICPDSIINAAAYTAVDKAETERELCRKINRDSVKIIAETAKEIGSFLVHISTDYVFNGDDGPYSEDDEVDPIGFYGLTKLEGEQEIKKSGCKASILRTNVLYGPAKFGRNDFVRWVVGELKTNKPVRIVDDQVNNPTYIDDLARAAVKSANKNIIGIFNTGGEEFLNRYEFTLLIAEFFNLDKSLITPVSTSEFKQPAKRPLKSGLKLDKSEKFLEFKSTPYKKAFELMKEELNL